VANADVHPSIRGMRTTLLGIGISIVLVLLKGIAGYLGHSYALIADATETGADVLSSALLWIGLRISTKPADTEHPYGHGKAEPIAGVVVSLFLFGSALWIAWHAIGYITTPHELPRKFTLYVLLLVILVKEAMYRYVLKIGTQINSHAVTADAHHHRSDAITSVAAFIGISIALAGGKGYEGADDWAALIASMIIIYNAVHLIKPSLDEIMDTAPSNEIVSKVRQLASEVPEVCKVEKCYVRKMGFDYYIDIHIEVDADISVTEGHRISHLVKDKMLQSDLMIKDVLVHVEPFAALMP
jgi:cation diffusion facilitator family transporter